MKAELLDCQRLNPDRALVDCLAIWKCAGILVNRHRPAMRIKSVSVDGRKFWGEYRSCDHFHEGSYTLKK